MSHSAHSWCHWPTNYSWTEERKLIQELKQDFFLSFRVFLFNFIRSIRSGLKLLHTTVATKVILSCQIMWQYMIPTCTCEIFLHATDSNTDEANRLVRSDLQTGAENQEVEVTVAWNATRTLRSTWRQISGFPRKHVSYNPFGFSSSLYTASSWPSAPCCFVFKHYRSFIKNK